MTTTKSYDFLNRLSSISSAPAASSAVSFTYAYNSANQRTRATLADGSYWLYDYDSLGQVRSGKKYWGDGTPVAGQQFEYGFDDIGNRKNTKAGGDENGWNLRLANYTNNSLNQITGRGVPGYVDIMGLSFATNSVTVNSQTAYRKGEYFRKELPVNNSSAPLWTNIIVAATGQTSVTGNVFLAKSAEVFTYDSDGNVTSDGLWTNTWSAENRLLKTESLSSVPAAGRAREEWTYLPDGRWIQRIVSTNNGSSYYPAYTNRYVWNRQVLLAILDHTNGLVMSFMRGLDLSGSLQGAGGVGGVLAVNFKTNGTHFCAYDGNGNVAALVSGTDGSESARYEYGPFAEPVRVSGPVAKQNPIRFSTQYADDVTGDVKYLFRDYDPDCGRWKSRDPIGEYGGKHLFAFALNGPVVYFDTDGRQLYNLCRICGQVALPWGHVCSAPPPPPRPAPLPIASAAWSSFLERQFGICRKLNEAGVFASHPRLAKAHDTAINWLSEMVNKSLCEGKGDQIGNPAFTIFPRVKDDPNELYGRNEMPILQTPGERSFLIGYYKYQLTNFRIVETGGNGGRNCISWRATVEIVDQWGWEREVYGDMFGEGVIGDALNDLVDLLFGKSRERVRGSFSLAGYVCCGECSDTRGGKTENNVSECED